MTPCLALAVEGPQTPTSEENACPQIPSSGSCSASPLRGAILTNPVSRFVPQQQAWLVERMGKFHRILQPGLAVLIPIIDKIQYVKSLKEVAIEIPSQSAITADNVTLDLDVLRPTSPRIGGVY